MSTFPTPAPLSENFDPVRFRSPGKERMLLYFGEIRCPAPFLVSLDIAESTEAGGPAAHMAFHWWRGGLNLVHKQTFWSFGDYSEPIF